MPFSRLWRKIFRAPQRRPIRNQNFRPRIEELEPRVVPAWNLAFSNGGATVGVSAATVGTTTTFTATATGATLNWTDVSNALVNGNVVINSGSTGTEAGNITNMFNIGLGGFSGSKILTFQSGSGTGLVGDIALGTLTTTDGNLSVVVSAAGNVTTSDLAAGTPQVPSRLASVQITTTGGSVSTKSSGSIYATDLAVQASGNIGTSGSFLSTNVSNLVANVTGKTGSIYINNTGNLAIGYSGDPFQGVATKGGAVSLATSAGKTITISGTGEPVSSSGGNITIAADSIAINTTNGNINAGSGKVTLEPKSTGTGIDVGLGTTTGDLNLTSAELNRITAGILQIGDDGLLTASITVTAPITAPAGWSTLELLLNSSTPPSTVTQTSGSSITVANLVVQANGGVTLTDSGNKVTTLAGIAGANPFSFANSTDLTVGSINGFTGIQTFGGGAVTVTTLGAGSLLTVSSAVDTSPTGKTAANITLSADRMAITAAINAPGNTATLQQGGTTTRNIDLGLGTTVGDLNISNAALAEITATTVDIGRTDNAGSISVTAALNPPNFPNLVLNDASNIGFNITTTGTQTYTDAVTLDSSVTLSSTGTGSNGNINFMSTIDGMSAGGQSLTVNTAGTTTFTDAVGGIIPLLSLSTDSGGSTEIDGGAVSTSGGQTYSDDVTLGGNTTLTTGAASTAAFSANLTLGLTSTTATDTLTVDGNLSLASTTTLATTFTGTGAGQFGHIAVSGNTIYSNATLALSYADGFTPAPGNHFDVVSNGAPGTGQFSNAPPPGPDIINGTSYFASYTGRAGADFILTVPATVTFGPWSSLGGAVKQLATGTDPNGDIELFGIGLPTINSRSGGGPPPWAPLYVNVQSGPNGGYSGWQPLGGLVSQIVVGTEQNGTLVVFGTGTNNAAYFLQQTKSGTNLSWGSWQPLGGYVKQLAVGTDPAGNLELFGIGGDNAVWYDVQKGNNASTFGGWNSLGGFVTQITVANNQSATPTQKGTLTVYGIGGDHAAWFRQQESAGNLTFSNWASLGGYVQQLTAGLDAQGNLELFGIGGDNAAWVDVQSGNNALSYGGWNSLGGYVTQLVVGQNSDGTLELIGIGGDHAAWVKKQTNPTGPAFDAFWTSLGGYVKQLALGTNQDLALSLFGIGGDNAAWISTQGG